jgi:hypothetical protein
MNTLSVVEGRASRNVKVWPIKIVSLGKKVFELKEHVTDVECELGIHYGVPDA